MKRDEKGTLMVLASECCELFEESQTDALALMRECWFCKWSDFRRSTRGFLQESPCHHPKNRINKDDTADKPTHNGTKGK